MARALRILCGKGGVGRTTMSLAFALRHARRGQRVLVVTSHPVSELAVTVSLAGLKESNPEAAANLFIVHIDSREVLQTVVRNNMGASSLTDAVLSSRIYQSLIEVIPGLKELAFIARMRELAESGASPEAPGGFDLLVWDAPATGHFLRTLEVAKNFDTYLSGPLALLGKDIARFLSDPSGFILLPVAILEEMAVDETIELCEKLRELKMSPAALICNLTSPLMPASEAETEALRRDFAAHVSGSGDTGFVLERHAIERTLFGKLRLAGSMPVQIVERRPAPASDVEMLLDIAESLQAIDGAPLA